MTLKRKDFKDVPIGENSFYLSHTLKGGVEIALEPSLSGYFIAFYRKEEGLLMEKIHIPFLDNYEIGIRRLSTHYKEYFNSPAERVRVNVLISVVNAILNAPKL